jgi:hypothetical protein
MTRNDGERGDIVLGWLTKLAATLAVVGVLGFDAVSLATAQFSAEDTAQQAARAAVETFGNTKDVQQAYDAAYAVAAADGATVDAPTFAPAQDGSVTLTLRTTASTLLVEKVPPARGWADVEKTVTARPSS